MGIDPPPGIVQLTASIHSVVLPLTDGGFHMIEVSARDIDKIFTKAMAINDACLIIQNPRFNYH
jgi:hypothetical protein